MITRKQVTSLIINAIIVKMLVTFPRSLFSYCGNAVWLAGIYSTGVAFGIFAIIRKIYVNDANVIGTAEKIGGTAFRIITGTVVFIVLGTNFVSLFRIFPEIIRLVLLQKTYTEIIGFIFILALIFGASCGIVSIARVTEIFLPVAGVIFAAFVLMLFPKTEIDNIFPLFGKGAAAIFVKGLSFMSVFADLLMLNILIPFTKNLDVYRRSGSHAILIGGACAVIIALMYGLCYSYPVSSKFLVPIYQLERLINLGDFFSRLEALFQFVWSICILLYSTLTIAVMAEVWRESFCLSHSKPLIAPITVGLCGFAVLPQSVNSMIAIENCIDSWIYIPAIIIPIIIAIIYKGKMFHVKQLKDK